MMMVALLLSTFHGLAGLGDEEDVAGEKDADAVVSPLRCSLLLCCVALVILLLPPSAAAAPPCSLPPGSQS